MRYRGWKIGDSRYSRFEIQEIQEHGKRERRLGKWKLESRNRAENGRRQEPAVPHVPTKPRKPLGMSKTGDDRAFAKSALEMTSRKPENSASAESWGGMAAIGDWRKRTATNCHPNKPSTRFGGGRLQVRNRPILVGWMENQHKRTQQTDGRALILHGPNPNSAQVLLITKDILGWVSGPNPIKP